MKEPMRREIYATKCMRYLTYLDYSTLEATGKNIQSQLEQKDERIGQLEQQMGKMQGMVEQLWKSLIRGDTPKTSVHQLSADEVKQKGVDVVVREFFEKKVGKPVKIETLDS